MTISIEQQLDIASEKLLQSSVDLLEKDRIIAALRSSLALQDTRIAALEAQQRRSALPFRRDQIQRDNQDEVAYERQQQSLMDGDHLVSKVQEDEQLRLAGRGHLVGG